MRKKHTFSNAFHNTEAVALARMIITTGKWTSYTLSPAQIDRLSRELCGVAGCTCGGFWRGRGQGWTPTQNGGAERYSNYAE
jgi:hypothetical protein